MQLSFINKQHEVGEVYSFFFKPLEDISWQAGQYLNLTMPDMAPVNAERLFTIASAPHEGLVQITTVVGGSPFKQRLNLLNPGDEVEADQIGGDFLYDIPDYVLQNYPKEIAADPKRLFIAGGIGVTPYISIVRDRLHKVLPLNATILYAGKNEKRPFLKELAEACRRDPSLKMVDYNSTRLTLAQLKHDVPDIDSWVVYLAGSQKFSETLGEGLIASGHPRNQIKYDYFDGYIDIEY